MDQKVAMLYNLRLVLLISTLFSLFNAIGVDSRLYIISFITFLLFSLTYIKKKWIPPLIIMVSCLLIIASLIIPATWPINRGNSAALSLFDVGFRIAGLLFALLSRKLFNMETKSEIEPGKSGVV